MGWRANLVSAWADIALAVVAKPLRVLAGMNAWLSNQARHPLMASTALQLRLGVSAKRMVTALSGASMVSALGVAAKASYVRRDSRVMTNCVDQPYLVVLVMIPAQVVAALTAYVLERATRTCRVPRGGAVRAKYAL